MKKALHLTSWYVEDGEYRVQTRSAAASRLLAAEGLTLAARAIGGGHLTIWVFYGDVLSLRKLLNKVKKGAQ